MLTNEIDPRPTGQAHYYYSDGELLSPPVGPPLDQFPPINMVDVERQPLSPSLSDPFSLVDIVNIGRQPDSSIEVIEHISDASTKHDTKINNIGWPLPPCGT